MKLGSKLAYRRLSFGTLIARRCSSAAHGTAILHDAMTLIGVTGTNGKTTTTGLIRHLFNEHETAASIGTLGAFDGRGQAVSSTAGSLTTPGPVDLQATLAAMRERGTTHVAMEASSHSLDQRRLDGVTFAAAVFTNLTRDHLDYHGTMESYLCSKLRLSSLLSLNGVEIVNLDDSAWLVMPTRSPRVTFGLHSAAEVRATDVVLDTGGSRFRLTGRFGSADVALPLLGDFNVANALAAAATGTGSRPLDRDRCAAPLGRRLRFPAEWSGSAIHPASYYAITPIRPMPWSARLRPSGRSPAAGSLSCLDVGEIATVGSGLSWVASRRSMRTYR